MPFFANLEECVAIVMVPFVLIPAAVSLVTFMVMILIEVADVAIND